MSQALGNESSPDRANSEPESNEIEQGAANTDGRYRYGKGLLTVAPKKLSSNSTDKKISAHWLERIRDSSYSKALNIVEKYGYVYRLLELFQYRVGKNWVEASFNITRDHNAQALAAYMLLPNIFGNKWFGAACSNCKYSGTPQNCSFFKQRAAEEEKQKRAERFEKMKQGTDKIWFTQEDLKDHLASELEKLANIINAELNKRSAKRPSRIQ
ncbi:hypothetical protein DL762_005557 [Monosporascus cannonballus]|uniref:Uncharacterized protein n=1 Tax=Monosporascus cannonballus TaxID=155416 RepID=A0ABY0H545_9PEZI|nr:hypothetical protein DL762_005557 [Monosporascus cannonballus]